MNTEDQKSLTQENLKKDLHDYIDTKLDLVKLKAIEKTGAIATGAIVGVSTTVLGYFFLLFLSLSAALGLGYLFDNYSLGFLCIAMFYGLVAAIIIIFKEKLITFPIVNMLLKKIYYKTETE